MMAKKKTINKSTIKLRMRLTLLDNAFSNKSIFKCVPFPKAMAAPKNVSQTNIIFASSSDHTGVLLNIYLPKTYQEDVDG